jgi:uncharacterized membrane protein
MGGEQPPPLPPIDPAGAPPPRAPAEEKILLVVCYLGLLALVPYLVARDAPLVRFHARQGLALGLLGVGCAGLALVPYLGFIGHLGLAGVLVLSLVGIVKALDGVSWRAPVAADVADRLQL